MKSAEHDLRCFATFWPQGCALDQPSSLTSTSNSTTSKAEKLKYGYFKDLLKMFALGHQLPNQPPAHCGHLRWPFVIVPPLPNTPPASPGPQHYWRLRDAGIGDEDEMWEAMRQEGEKQKDDDELGCVGVLLEYLSEPGYPPPRQSPIPNYCCWRLWKG